MPLSIRAGLTRRQPLRHHVVGLVDENAPRRRNNHLLEHYRRRPACPAWLICRRIVRAHGNLPAGQRTREGPPGATSGHPEEESVELAGHVQGQYTECTKNFGQNSHSREERPLRLRKGSHHDCRDTGHIKENPIPHVRARPRWALDRTDAVVGAIRPDADPSGAADGLTAEACATRHTSKATSETPARPGSRQTRVVEWD